jgi:hypothetical protein
VFPLPLAGLSYSPRVVAPILIEVVADPPPPAELRDALVASCSSVAGAAGCALAAPEAAEARARVVVTFDAAYARVRVVLDRGTSGEPAREASFREIDPLRERFRAAGLVVAGLVTDVERSSAPPESAPAPAAPDPAVVDDGEGARRGPGIALALLGRLAWTDVRPWAGVALAADFPVGSSAFVVVSRIDYEHTLSATPAGISEQRLAGGVGVGATARWLHGRFELAPRVRVELQDLNASVTEPATGRSGASGRVLVGGAGELDARISFGGVVGVVLGAELDWFGGSTSIQVHDKLKSVLPAWMYGVNAGLNVRIP